MTTKAITENDIEMCAKVFMQAYNQPPWNYQWQFEDALKYLKEYYVSPDFKGFLLFDGEIFAGAMFAHAKTWWTGPQLYIDELFIAPNEQKKGYGKAIIRFAEQLSSTEGLGTITLMTHKYMPAMKFYENIDFMHAQPLVILFKQLED